MYKFLALIVGFFCFLNLPFAMATGSGGVSQTSPPAQQTPIPTPPTTQQNLFSNTPTNDTPAAGPYYFGYAWPYGDIDMQALVGAQGTQGTQGAQRGPMLVELYTDPGCIYSPLGHHLMNDLIRKTNVIAFTCQSDLLRMASGDPMIVPQCSDRHGFYAYKNNRSRMTPQLAINGHSLVNAYLYDQVIKTIKLMKLLTPQRLEIKQTGKKDEYYVALPAMQFGETTDFDDRLKVSLVEYQKPIHHKITEGPNAGAEIEILHAVSRIIPLPDWFGQAGKYNFTWTPTPNALGAVLLFESKDTGLYGVGEIKL